jgi:hypothetical protein
MCSSEPALEVEAERLRWWRWVVEVDCFRGRGASKRENSDGELDLLREPAGEATGSGSGAAGRPGLRGSALMRKSKSSLSVIREIYKEQNAN